MTNDEHRPFIIERSGRDGRIKLGPEARFWAEQHNMSLVEMARYLLARDEQKELEAPELPELPAI
jgi:hypothetical protein